MSNATDLAALKAGTPTTAANAGWSQPTPAAPPAGGTPADPNAAPAPVYRYTSPQSTNPPAQPAAASSPAVPAQAPGAAAAPGTPGATPSPDGSGYANPIQSYYDTLPKTAPTVDDENQIRESYRQQAQSQIDAVNAHYNSMVAQDTQQAENRTGQTRAVNARSGDLGSDFATADQAQTDQYNKQIADQTEAGRQAALASITQNINNNAEAEILAKKQAAQGNAQAYISWLTQTQADAKANVATIAQQGIQLPPEQMAALQKQTGWNPMVFDAYYNANKQQGTGVKYSYTSLGNGTVLRTGVMANGQAVPEQKFQYELGPNDEFQVTQNGTPLIITKSGDQITGVKVAPGFDTGDLATKFVPVYSNGSVSLLNTLTGQITQGTGTSSNNGQPVPPGGFRTDRNNNPTAMTTDVAQSLGLVQGQDYAQGDPFTDAHGSTLYTAKLIGDPIQTTIKGLDQGGFYTASGQPRWSYLASLPTADQQAIQNWKAATPDQKAQVVADMYKAEGGSGALTGQSGSSDAAPFDPTNKDGIDALAATYLQGGTIPKGNGKTSATAGTITARANAIAAQLGIVEPGEAFDQTALKADQKANMKVLLDQVPQRAQIQSNLDAADSNFTMLTTFMRQHGLNSNDVPLSNQLQQAINSGGIAGPDAVGAQAAMNSALAGLSTEYSQILARGGQRNETVDKEAAKLIPGNISPAELQDVINYIKAEGANVLKSKDTAIENAKKAFGNFSSTSSSSSGSSNDPLGIR